MAPYLPPSKKRPWLPEPTERKHQGRAERSKLYNTALWQRTRKEQMQREPLCRSCAEMNPPRITAATIADHIKPYNTVKGKISFTDPSNLQSLCSSCHARKSAAERH